MVALTSMLANDEAERLAAVDRYMVMDTAPEPAFDRIVDLARAIFDTPMALVSFVDQTRQWFKARTGIEPVETPRAWAFCDYAIRQTGVTVVTDALQDLRFSQNPLVVGVPRIRFYAGAPIRTPDGHHLGTVCILSDTPRDLSEIERKRLVALADVAANELELRLQNHRVACLAEERRFLLHEVDHRLQHSLRLVSEVLQQQARTAPSPELRRALLGASDRIVTVALLCGDLRSGGGDELDGADYLRWLAGELQAAYLDGDMVRRVFILPAAGLVIPMRLRPRVGFVVSELVANAVKHGGGAITLSAHNDGRALVLTVQDEGPGFVLPRTLSGGDLGDGLRLVAALSDSLRIDPGRTSILRVVIGDVE